MVWKLFLKPGKPRHCCGRGRAEDRALPCPWRTPCRLTCHPLGPVPKRECAPTAPVQSAGPAAAGTGTAGGLRRPALRGLAVPLLPPGLLGRHRKVAGTRKLCDTLVKELSFKGQEQAQN